ncbi:MAG: hypothetical protein JWN22_1320 [Nocardioides sp.]|jgi:hypothetical protein|nr:hypothetical protein [Nocardioides sp.]
MWVRLRRALLDEPPVTGTSGHGYSVASEPAMSIGAKALTLLLTQSEWTHRRAETVSLEPHGETRQRTSWDFTVDPALVIEASKDRMAVPLATLLKQPLKRLDVTDASGSALSIWGKEDNGRLATQALESGFLGIMHRPISEAEFGLLEGIVFAATGAEAKPLLDKLVEVLPTDDDNAEVFLALAEDLGANFLLVVELPMAAAGARSLVKMKYEGDLGEEEEYSRWSTVHNAYIDGAAWSSAASWHVELHAPPGLGIRQFVKMSWDSDEEDQVQDGESPAVGVTAHLSGSTTPVGSLSWAALELRPARAGLVNQTLVGAVVAWLLLLAGCIWIEPLFEAVLDPNRASAVAAVMLAVPAFLIALLSRGPEHGLVSRLLLVPRLVNLATAAVLLATAAAVVLGLTEPALEWTLRVLWVAQTMLLIVAGTVRTHSVGARP